MLILHRAIWAAVGRYARHRLRSVGWLHFAVECVGTVHRTIYRAIRYEMIVWGVSRRPQPTQAQAIAFWDALYRDGGGD